MASTSPHPNNLAIKFRGKAEKERPRMPVVSKAQNAAMHSAAEGKSTLGIPKSVGAEFVADQQPGDVKSLPARAPKPRGRIGKLRERGLISDKEAAKQGWK